MTGPALPADTDVIVAGSGAAGLTAALAAARSGARVLLVEKASALGGTTALSFGRTWVPANHLSTRGR
jgi:3-oxosteroid 1-dehydrogenase